jgi:hypothetical protein
MHSTALRSKQQNALDGDSRRLGLRIGPSALRYLCLQSTKQIRWIQAGSLPRRIFPR